MLSAEFCWNFHVHLSLAQIVIIFNKKFSGGVEYFRFPGVAHYAKTFEM